MNDQADEWDRCDMIQPREVLTARVCTAVSLGAAAGCVCGVAAVATLDGGELPTFLKFWVPVASLLAGALAVLRMLHSFGHPGGAGYLRAVNGMVSAAFFAALVAGTLSLPVYGTMFGPLIAVTVLIAAPSVLAVWFLALSAAHILLVRERLAHRAMRVRTNFGYKRAS